LDTEVAVSIPSVLDPKVFKAYDVRGIYPTEIDEEGAYAVGRAFVEQFEPEKIAVGHDMRVTSPAMAEAVTNGAAAAGANVLQLGLSAQRWSISRSATLGSTAASRSPPRTIRRRYTGLKIVRGGALPVGGSRDCSISATGP
jgi:phosphomannomutase